MSYIYSNGRVLAKVDIMEYKLPIRPRVRIDGFGGAVGTSRGLKKPGFAIVRVPSNTNFNQQHLEIEIEDMKFRFEIDSENYSSGFRFFTGSIY